LSHIQLIFAIIACPQGEQFLGAFAKLWRATISFTMSVHLSAWNDLAHTEQIFMKIYTWAFFKNLSRKFKFH